MRKKNLFNLSRNSKQVFDELKPGEATVLDVTIFCYELVNMLTSIEVPPSMLETAYESLLQRKLDHGKDWSKQDDLWIQSQCNQLHSRLTAYHEARIKANDPASS